jgi:lysophospholipase L1-like esterase
MIECLILGDSIAVGVGTARPECITVAESGINSKAFVRAQPDRTEAHMAVISIGTNDSGIDTAMYVTMLRSRVIADRVYWILPSERLRPNERAIVLKVAKQFSDATISIPTDVLYPDGIHPTSVGYKLLASKAR